MFLGVSLKMYFDYAETVAWCLRVAELAARHPALTSGGVALVVLPSFPGLVAARDAFSGTPVGIGAQDLFWEDRGAFTGEVGGRDLAQIGCSYVEVGHAERRRIFGEDAAVISAKVAAALRNSLTPILCIGEAERMSGGEASDRCIAQLEEALAESGEEGGIVAAYEPVWAIGAERPASPDHIEEVCGAVRTWLSERDGRAGSRVIYGGSAGPGLLSTLGPVVDGLFLGRYAHDTHALGSILDETWDLLR